MCALSTGKALHSYSVQFEWRGLCRSGVMCVLPGLVTSGAGGAHSCRFGVLMLISGIVTDGSVSKSNVSTVILPEHVCVFNFIVAQHCAVGKAIS